MIRNIKNSIFCIHLDMDAFISRYITPSIAELRSSRLVSALVELIAEDSSISDSEDFFVIPSGKCISKLELTSRSIFLIQPFLLGVWHYIVTNRRDNLVGAETYNHWYSPSVPAKAQTGLTASRFADYFAEFYMRTYHDEKFEFSYEEFEAYFSALKERRRESDENVQAGDFLNDLQHCLCLIYFEDAKYHFTHRSFQEYFCALFFSRQKDRTLGRIGDFFDRQSHYWFSDRTFDMLYDMIPEKVEEYIFKPYLDNLIDKCQSGDGYWTFLATAHPSIEYYYDMLDDVSNEPRSFLLRFIVKTLGGFENSSLDDFPLYKEFITETFVDVNDGLDTQLLTLNDAESGDWEWISEPVGYELSLDISKLLADKETYAEALQKLDADDCILKKEYMRVMEYQQKLSKKFVVSSDDFFDQF